MTNLIPPKARQAVKREYWVRVCSVWALLLSIVFVVLAAILAPTYVLFNAQLEGLLLEEATKENGRAAEYERALDTITEANETAAQLAVRDTAVSASTLLAAIEAAQGEAITLSSYRYAQEKGVVQHVIIQGVAEDRTALASFSENLKRSPYFSEANVPVSSLVRDQNLPFNLTVSVNQNSE